MTDERLLLHLHKLLHEDAKHRQDDMKSVQKVQVTEMNKLLDSMAIEDGFADFCKNHTADFLTCQPNTAPSAGDIKALDAMGIVALCFPCIRFADNGKTAKGMWLAETADGYKAVAAQFANWGGQWKLWKLICSPTTDDLPAEGYERLYPDPKEKPAEMPQMGAGAPPMGGMPPMGAGAPPMGGGMPPMGGAPDGAPPMGGPGDPGGPGGEDAAPFDPDARSDVFDMEGDYARLNKDITMLTTMAMPDFKGSIDEASALMKKSRKAVSPDYIAARVRREIK